MTSLWRMNPPDVTHVTDTPDTRGQPVQRAQCWRLAGRPGHPAGRWKEQLYELWDGAVERSRARLNAALAKGGLDQPVQLAHPDGRHANLRRLICDLIEEYGRHTGHADLLREAVDGRVGEDPPAGWRPKSGHFSVTG
jgi:uncharacterized protein DUF664